MRRVQSEMEALLAPFQLGVGTPDGATSIIHATRNLLDQADLDPSVCCLQVDFSNAFNLVDRNIMLQAVQDMCPAIACFAHWLYKYPSLLCVANSSEKLLSSCGVQQGDPLGPLLFSLVLQILILEISDQFPDLKLNAWYLDDGTLIGPSDTTRSIVSLLKTRGPELGLHLNASKLLELVDQDNILKSYQVTFT